MRGFIVPDTETDGLDDLEATSRSGTRPGTDVAHRIGGRKLSRKQGPRLSLFKNLTVSVLRYERVKTTEAKAKEIGGRVEKAITRSVVTSRPVERSRPSFRMSRWSNKLFDEIAPKYADRTSGYPDRPDRTAPGRRRRDRPDRAGLTEERTVRRRDAEPSRRRRRG